jgi:hypothetical protein
MKIRKHKQYAGFPEKGISYHSKDYVASYAGTDPEKLSVAKEMSKHHGSGSQDAQSSSATPSDTNPGNAEVPMQSTAGASSTGATVPMNTKSGVS